MIIMMKMTNMVMIMGIILMLMRTTKKTDNYLDYTPFKYYYLVKNKLEIFEDALFVSSKTSTHKMEKLAH